VWVKLVLDAFARPPVGAAIFYKIMINKIKTS